MKHRSAAVFFDVDGVLLDSLPEHLRICRDKALEYGLSGVVVPDISEFRRMVNQGTRVSPMLNFFLAVGFPPAAAERAVRDYEHEFTARYRPPTFAGIDAMLGRLRAGGIALGLVTSNTRGNVESALGASLDHFDRRCRFYFDSDAQPRSKTSYLQQGAQAIRVPTGDCTYVGDQPADVRAADEAQTKFLGVTFGWGLIPGQPGVTLVDSVSGIADALLAPP